MRLPQAWQIKGYKKAFSTNSWNISPKVHAYRFVVTPDEAVRRCDTVANKWRPKGGLEWTCTRFGLIYYPIWYTGAELRFTLDKERRDAGLRADLSLFGGMPGHYDPFLSLCAFVHLGSPQ
jgi:hypothetical protein